MIKKSLLLLTIVFIGFSVNAQDLKRKTEKLLEKSQNALNSRNWNSAIQYMNEAVSNEPDNFQVHLEKAYLYYSVRDFPKMLPSLKKAYQLNPDWKAKYHEFYFVLGKESFENGNYEFAQGPIDKYLEKGYNEQSLQLSEVISKSIEFALDALADSDLSAYKVQKIESQQIFRSVYFPFFTLYPEDDMYFTAQRLRSLEEGIYRAELDGTKFKRVEEVPTVNSKESEGAAAVSADGRVMVFTGCNRRGGYGSCDLYISYKKNNKWTAPENLGSNINTRNWESQPYLSSDGRLLIFSSNRAGGIGKRDLYYSTKDIDGKWKPAKNLGSTINTFADEISPFLDLSGDTLYFSSNGRIGMGGFDFFKVAWNSQDSPGNIGLPMNSFQDETSFHKKLDGSIYWARELKSDEKYPPSEILFINKEAALDSLLLVYGTVKDASSNNPLEASIQIFDLETDSLLRETFSDAVTGSYKVLIPNKSDYSFYVESTGYLFRSLKVNDIDGVQHEQDFNLEAIEAGKSISLNNIYFDFDSYELDEKSKREIEKILM
jgi:tetratricopeptide (TPR) repeat protein